MCKVKIRPLSWSPFPGPAYLGSGSSGSFHSSAVDAKGLRHQGSDYAETAPWMNDRVKSVAPEYPHSERLYWHQGEGLIRLKLDFKTGLVTKATVIKSTGFSALDNAAVTAFQRWSWKPGKWKEIDLPISFVIGGSPLRAGAVQTADVKALLREALAAEKAHNYNKAISICNKLINGNPKLAAAYNIRAFAYIKKRNVNKAIADLNEAIRLDQRKGYYLTRGMAYHERGQITQSVADQDKAIADYSEAIRLDPKYACAYYDRANADDDKARLIQSTASLAEAIADSNTALRLKPGYAEAYVSRGIAYINNGELDKAIKDFNEAIRLNPKLSCAYSNLGACYHCQGEYDKSNAQFTKAIQFSPTPITYINRATTYDSAGDYDKAINDCSTALRVAQNDVTWSARAYLERALAYNHKHDYDKAQSDFNKLTHMDTKDWDIYNAIGWFLATCPDAKFRDGRKAVQYAIEASKLAKPIESRAADTLAAAYAESGDFERAIKSEEEYVQSPNLSGERKAEAKSRLALYQSHGSYRDDKKSPAPDCGPFGAFH